MKKSEEATASEDNNPVDRISDLPDHVLHMVLSGLESTEEAVRTTILSKRWNGLWTSVPKIDIDYLPEYHFLKRKVPDLFKSEKFVNRVLANKSVDLDSFRLRCLDFYDMSTLGRWIHAALTRNVKLIDLMYSSKDDSEHFKDIKLPECPVNCDSLKELRLHLLSRPLKLPYFAEFQAVRVLVLHGVDLSYNISSDCFTQLKNLEDLSLINCFMNGSRSATCPNLKNLKIYNRIHDRNYYGDIRINCPKLVNLELTGLIAYDVFVDHPNSLKKAVIYRRYMLEKLPYVDLFAIISGVESLSIGLYFLFQFLEKGRIIPSLPNLKTLEITTTINSFTIGVLRQILIHPNVDSIHLIIEKITYGSEYWTLEDTESMRILTRHLKRVEFVEFDGENSKLEIARYFLEHGNALEEMVFRWNNKPNYHENSMKIMKELSNVQKASSNVKLISLSTKLDFW